MKEIVRCAAYIPGEPAGVRFPGKTPYIHNIVHVSVVWGCRGTKITTRNRLMRYYTATVGVSTTAPVVCRSFTVRVPAGDHNAISSLQSTHCIVRSIAMATGLEARLARWEKDCWNREWETEDRCRGGGGECERAGTTVTGEESRKGRAG